MKKLTKNSRKGGARRPFSFHEVEADVKPEVRMFLYKHMKGTQLRPNIFEVIEEEGLFLYHLTKVGILRENWHGRNKNKPIWKPHSYVRYENMQLIEPRWNEKLKKLTGKALVKGFRSW